MTAPDPAAEALAKIIDPDAFGERNPNFRRTGKFKYEPRSHQQWALGLAAAILAAIRAGQVPGVEAK